MLPIDLNGRRALVTGASRGVGRSIAVMLATAGADVGIGYRSRRDEAEAVAAEVRGLGGRAFVEGGDLADPETSRRSVERAVEAFGGLDVFVGNAGVWPPEDVPLHDLEPARWRRTLSINLDGVYHGLRAAIPHLTDGGRVVLVGSTAGRRGEAGHADYAAAKGALQALVKSLAVELGPRRITVNCVAPGWIDTEMCAAPFSGGGRERIEATIPLGRVASPEDVAGPVVFLCSGLARHVTGEIFDVNGGSVLCG